MARVAVIGGGYGGITAARALDSVADVVLIEQKDQFVHHAASLLALVDHAWSEAIFMPYDNLLTNGRVCIGTVLKIEGNRIHIFGQEPLEADYIIIATGSSYPFPSKHTNASTELSRLQLAQLHADLEGASRVLLVGGGPVGLEMAGSLKSTFPNIDTVVLEHHDRILADDSYANEFREMVMQQAIEMGITLIVGDALAELPPTQPATLGPFAVQTVGGRTLEADMWFQCHGSKPATGFLRSSSYRDSINPDGTLKVRPTLQLVGHDNVYAIGDVTDIPETKRADAARRHAQVTVANLVEQLEGRQPSHTYVPNVNWMVLPLGPTHGASQLVDNQGNARVVGAAHTAAIQTDSLMLSKVRAQLNLD